jgi:hypothetical protein
VVAHLIEKLIKSKLLINWQFELSPLQKFFKVVFIEISILSESFDAHSLLIQVVDDVQKKPR